MFTKLRPRAAESPNLFRRTLNGITTPTTHGRTGLIILTTTSCPPPPLSTPGRHAFPRSLLSASWRAVIIRLFISNGGNNVPYTTFGRSRRRARLARLRTLRPRRG